VEALHQDEQGEYVSGMANEETSQTEGTVTFDIRFDAIAPDDGRLISLIINVEVQADYYPGYPLTKRAIYYLGRMISSQYGKVFTKSHYEKIEKVYSIWICVDPPNYRENTINKYEMTETCIVGDVKEVREHYDLMTVVMLCLGDPEKAEYKSILKMLDVLLSTETKPEEKKKTLSEEFNIAMTQKMESEVLEMGGYGDWVEKKITERVVKRVTEEVTAQVTEEVTAQVTEEVTAKVTEEITEQVTEEVTAQVTEEVTAQVTEEVTAKVTEEVTEQVTEKVTAKVKADTKKENTFRNISSLMETMGWTAEETMNNLKIPQTEQAQYLALLS
jgi:hypothetical protein